MKTETPRTRRVVCNDSFAPRYYHGNEDLRFEPVKPEELREMFRAAKAGNMEVRETLIKRYLLFTLKQGRRFCANKLPADETTSAANEALMLAIDRFDPEHGSEAAFGSFLIPYIRAAIARCWRAREPVNFKHSVPPPPTETCRTEPGIDTVCAQTFEQEEHNEFMKGQLLEIASALPAREQKVIQLHYVESKNFADIGRELKLSREGVRQIHDRILALLKKKLVARGITSSQ